MSSEEFSEEDLSSNSNSPDASEVGDARDEYQGSDLDHIAHQLVEHMPRGVEGMRLVHGMVQIMSPDSQSEVAYILATHYDRWRTDGLIPPPAIQTFQADEEYVDETANAGTIDMTKFRSIPNILQPRNLRLRKELVLSKSVEKMVNNTHGDEMISMFNHIRSLARSTDVDTYKVFYKDLSDVIFLRMHVPWYSWPKVDKTPYTKEAVIEIVKKYNKGTFDQTEIAYNQTVIDVLHLFNDRKTKDTLPLIHDELVLAREEIEKVQQKRRAQAMLICDFATERMTASMATRQEYPIEEIPWDPVIPPRPEISKYFVNYPGDACKGTTEALGLESKEKIVGGSTTCVVCDNVSDVLQKPCNHCIYCIECIRDYYKKDIRLSCSVCREDVTKFEYLRTMYKRKRE